MAELSTLYSDHIALQEQLADVQARFDAKKGDYTAACNALFEQWKQDNAGGRVYFDAVFTDEDNAVKYFLLVTGSDADNPAPPAKSG